MSLTVMAFMLKTFVDGFKEVWVKKKEADIQKNLQENLIAVETQSFSGKMQIIRSMLSEKADTFSKELNEVKNNISFNAKNEKKSEKKKHLPMFLTGALTTAGIIALGYLSLHNIRKSEQCIKTGSKWKMWCFDEV